METAFHLCQSQECDKTVLRMTRRPHLVGRTVFRLETEALRRNRTTSLTSRHSQWAFSWSPVIHIGQWAFSWSPVIHIGQWAFTWSPVIQISQWDFSVNVLFHLCQWSFSWTPLNHFSKLVFSQCAKHMNL